LKKGANAKTQRREDAKKTEDQLCVLAALRLCAPSGSDEEGIGGDDAADALRYYLVATKGRELKLRKLRRV
jgi:hypothetical protein